MASGLQAVRDILPKKAMSEQKLKAVDCIFWARHFRAEGAAHAKALSVKGA